VWERTGAEIAEKLTIPSSTRALGPTRYTAAKAGKYRLTVVGGDDGDALPGSPFDINVAVRD